jgi:hypothetical protein
MLDWFSFASLDFVFMLRTARFMEMHWGWCAPAAWWERRWHPHCSYVRKERNKHICPEELCPVIHWSCEYRFDAPPRNEPFDAHERIFAPRRN